MGPSRRPCSGLTLQITTACCSPALPGVSVQRFGTPASRCPSRQRRAPRDRGVRFPLTPPRRAGAVVVTVTAPLCSTGLAADRGEAERGDLTAATTDYTTPGSGSARGAWANWTILGNSLPLSLTPPPPFPPPPAGFDVSLANVG